MKHEVQLVIDECREQFAALVSRMFVAAGEKLTIAILAEDLEDHIAELIARQTDGIARRYSESVH